jgi:WD40 repeat protein
MRWLVVGLSALLLASCGSTPRSSAPGAARLPAPRMILVGGHAADVAFGDGMALYAVTPDTLMRVRASRQHPLRRAPRNVSFLALSPNAETLIEERRSPSRIFLRAIRWRTGTMIWEIPFDENPYESSHVAWAADGRRFAVETGGRTNVWVIDRATGRVLRQAHSSGYLGRQPFSPDDQTLALNTNPAQLLDLRTGTGHHLGPSEGLDRAAWSPDGSTIAASISSGMLFVDVRTGRWRRLSIAALIPAWSPDGHMIAVFRIVSRGYDVAVLDAANGRTLSHHHFTNGFESSALAWSPDSRQLAFTST